MGRLTAFLEKPPRAKLDSVRFRWMKLLASLPYCPVRYRLALGPGESVGFWWSSVFMAFVSEKPMFEYCGSDATYLRLLWRLLRPGGVFFDVGAFHGLYTTIAARRTGSTGSVFSFEPSRRDRRRLMLHVAMNRLDNVRVEPYAVGSSAGVSEFYVVRRGFTTMNSLRPPATAHPIKRTAAPTIGLDDYCANSGVRNVDLLKLDIEGGELELMRGAKTLFEDVRPIVLCEVLDWVTRPWGYEAREIVRCLKAQGYEWFEVDEGGRLRAHREQESYDAIENYLAVPAERRDAIESLAAP